MSQDIANPDNSTSQLDRCIERIIANRVQLYNNLQKIRDQYYYTTVQKCHKIVTNMKKISEIMISNKYFNGSNIFTQDLNKTLQIINTASEAILKAIINFKKLKQEREDIICFENSIENFLYIIEIFVSIIENIASKVKNETDENKIQMINNILGLECTLFNIAVKIKITEERPFIELKYIEIYKFHNIIFDIKDNLKGFESVCGSGKTIFLPIILLCQNMRCQIDSPFLIITQPTPRHIEPKEEFFNQIISKYVTIVSDPDKLFEMYNEYEKTKKITKLVLALLTPHNMLPLMNRLKNNKVFYPCTKFVFDEIHQRTFHLDVLISQFGRLSQENYFNNALHVIMTSASISQSMLNPFRNKMQKIQLIKSPPYEIIERPPIIEENIQKINNEIVVDQTINVIKEMSYSEVEEGHILCFLSGIGVCSKLKNAVFLKLRNSEETLSQRKIVILQTTLKPKETIESYYRRLNEEFTFNESVREGKKYHNDFLYFVPIVLSGLVDDAIYELAQNEFPGDLKKINKLICSTPMIESSFTIDRLSVVVDSGLVKEIGFDNRNCLPTSKEKQASMESMNQRKGRLGRTMNGVYISIHAPDDQILDVQTPPIQRTDLTTNILSMKDISIDFEKITNLPTPPNWHNYSFSMKTLKRINAIDSYSLEITPFGKNLLKYINVPYITVYYATAIVNFIARFNQKDKKYAAFFAAYISNIIAMDNLIIEEDMSEKMSRLFDENSDLVTLINSLSILLKSNIKDNDKLRNLVESYGFSYSNYVVFKDYLQKVVELHSPGTTVEDFINSTDDFVNKNNGIINIIEDFIPDIANAFPYWKKNHSIKFKYVSGAGGFDSKPTIVFKGDYHLGFNYGSRFSEVHICKRPGWNGIMIPSDCYCFNISRNSNLKTNFGHLIHRKYKNSRGEIASIECNKVALNPWFNVLLDTYLKDANLKIKYFNKSNINNPFIGREKQMFHYSNTGERVFVSFIPCDQYVKQYIIDSINKCLKLMPFIPRSILIYRDDIQSIIEVTSIGTEHYETSISTDAHGNYLDCTSINYCLEHIEELSKSNSSIRICALFTNNTCNLKVFDRKKLYIIDENSNNPPLINVVMKQVRKLPNYYRNYHFYDDYMYDLELFQFPTRFIHPALLYYHQTLDNIKEWFTKHCSYAHVVKVIGHRFLMSRKDILELQKHLHFEKDKIKEEMKLKYVAIPVSSHVYSKGYLTIREHPTWEYYNRFKVIITTTEEAEEVNKFIDSIKNDKEDEQENQTETLCCLYICDDPDNPVLTNYPITIYNEDGTTYTNKMCRDCLVDTLKVSTESYYSNGEIDHDALSNISSKPFVIPSVTSKETKNGMECWPQVPLGQMISALISNDDELSDLVSAWLQGVSEYTVRVMAKDRITFCPYHPQYLFKFNQDGFNDYMCKVNGCSNIFCEYCKGWHDTNYICDERKNGYIFEWPTKCPKCLTPTFKDGGCNHITCRCGCHWCYKCGEGFTSADQCYRHLSKMHGGCFDYNII